MSAPDTWERRLGIAEWEPRKMTICISAICDEGRAIINVGDDLVGVGFTGGELGRTKWDTLCNDWMVGIAGTVSSANEALEWARKDQGLMKTTGLFEVRSLLETAYWPAPGLDDTRLS